MEEECHDTEWGIPTDDDRLLFEALLLAVPKKSWIENSTFTASPFAP